jgi:hypothetical protein
VAEFKSINAEDCGFAACAAVAFFSSVFAVFCAFEELSRINNRTIKNDTGAGFRFIGVSCVGGHCGGT